MGFLELFPDIFEEKRIRDMGYQAYRDLWWVPEWTWRWAGNFLKLSRKQTKLEQ